MVPSTVMVKPAGVVANVIDVLALHGAVVANSVAKPSRKPTRFILISLSFSLGSGLVLLLDSFVLCGWP